MEYFETFTHILSIAAMGAMAIAAGVFSVMGNVERSSNCLLWIVALSLLKM